MTDDQNEKEKVVDISDLLVLSQHKAKTAILLATAEKSLSDYKLSDAEYKALITKVYFKYNLSPEDRLNDQTGEIMYADVTDEDKADEDNTDDSEDKPKA